MTRRLNSPRVGKPFGAVEGAESGGAYGKSLDDTWLGRKVNAMVNGSEVCRRGQKRKLGLIRRRKRLASKVST